MDDWALNEHKRRKLSHNLGRTIQDAHYGSRMPAYAKTFLRHVNLEAYEVIGTPALNEQSPFGHPWSGGQGQGVYFRSGMDINEEGNMLLTGGTLEKLRIWQLDLTAPETLSRQHRHFFNSEEAKYHRTVKFVPGPEKIVAALDYRGRCIDVFNTATRQYVRRLIESTNICMDSIAFPGEKTKCVAAGLETGEVHMWDMRGKSMTRLYQTGQRSVLSLVASPDGRVLIAGHEDGTVTFWDMRGGRGPAVFGANKWSSYTELDRFNLKTLDCPPSKSPAFSKGLLSLVLDPFCSTRIAFFDSQGNAGCMDLRSRSITHSVKLCLERKEFRDTLHLGYDTRCAWMKNGTFLVCLPHLQTITGVDFNSRQQTNYPLSLQDDPLIEFARLKLKFVPWSIAVHPSSENLYIRSTQDTVALGTPFARGQDSSEANGEDEDPSHSLYWNDSVM